MKKFNVSDEHILIAILLVISVGTAVTVVMDDLYMFLAISLGTLSVGVLGHVIKDIIDDYKE